MVDDFNENDTNRPWAKTKAYLTKRKLTYSELLDLAAQSMLLVKIQEGENKTLKNVIDNLLGRDIVKSGVWSI